MILKSLCKCGGGVIVIAYYDNFEREYYVSHGICQVCLKNIVLPQEKYRDFRKSEL